VFHLRVTDANYEAIEDWFLCEAHPALDVTPSEFDRIIFQHKDRVLELAARGRTGDASASASA
jgi:hypothetical protein